MKNTKGNHRRMEFMAINHHGVIGNTYDTPTISRGAIKA